jgi:hypothetical protein
VVRTAMSRLAADGWLERRKAGRNSFYRLAGKGRQTFDAATRQSGTIPTAYTQVVSGNSSNDALLEDSTLFGSDVLLLRTIHGSIATQTAARPDANFAPAFAGQKWSVTYVGRLDRGDGNITDAYLAFAVGDQPDFTGPSSPTADFGFVVQGNASWFAFVDGPLPPNGSGAAGSLRSPDLWSGVFTVTITIDETLPQPTAALWCRRPEHLQLRSMEY